MGRIFIMALLSVFYLTVVPRWNMMKWQEFGKERYKDALSSGCRAAAIVRPYGDSTFIDLNDYAYGFGKGEKHAKNIPIDKNKALLWFYRLFFENIGAEDDLIRQHELKKYMPMKAMATYNRLYIADVNDIWKVNDLPYTNLAYPHLEFSLSDQVFDKILGEWHNASDYGLSDEQCKVIVSRFVREQMNMFINTRENFDSKKYYNITIGEGDWDPSSMPISGVSFIVMTEGMPITAMDVHKPGSKLYTFAVGGAEIVRIIE